MTKYLMCMYWGHICIFISNMKFLSLILWLGGLCTDANDTDNDADDTNANADDTDNYARRTNHDYNLNMHCIYLLWSKCKIIPDNL